MGQPIGKIKGYVSYSDYYSLTNGSNEGLAMLGAEAKLKTNTNISIGVGNDWNIDKDGHSTNKPVAEVKVTQPIGQAGDFKFNTQARIRVIGGTPQFRGVAGASYPINKNSSVYSSVHITEKKGNWTTGGWVGFSYKKVSVEMQGDYNMTTNTAGATANFIVKI